MDKISLGEIYEQRLSNDKNKNLAGFTSMFYYKIWLLLKL